MPVTSTIVATKGADAAAGSNPMRRNTKGNIAPMSAPKSTTPIRLTEKQRTLLRELDATLKDERHSPQTRSWKDKVKEFFQ